MRLVRGPPLQPRRGTSSNLDHLTPVFNGGIRLFNLWRKTWRSVSSLTTLIFRQRHSARRVPFLVRASAGVHLTPVQYQVGKCNDCLRSLVTLKCYLTRQCPSPVGWHLNEYWRNGKSCSIYLRVLDPHYLHGMITRSWRVSHTLSGRSHSVSRNRTLLGSSCLKRTVWRMVSISPGTDLVFDGSTGDKAPSLLLRVNILPQIGHWPTRSELDVEGFRSMSLSCGNTRPDLRAPPIISAFGTS